MIRSSPSLFLAAALYVYVVAIVITTQAQGVTAQGDPYSLSSTPTTLFTEDVAPMLLTFEVFDSRSVLTSGYKLLIDTLPLPPSSSFPEFFFSKSGDVSDTGAAVTAGDSLDAIRTLSAGAPEFELYFHVDLANYFTDSTLAVIVVPYNGDEVIPDDRRFTKKFSVVDVPDFVVFSNGVMDTTITVFPHVFTSIAGLEVTDVDPVPRDLSLTFDMDSNTAVKYGGTALLSTDNCAVSTSVTCVACLFDLNGCSDRTLAFSATSVDCNELFDNLFMSNVLEGDTKFDVTLLDQIPNGLTYMETYTINPVGGAYQPPTAVCKDFTVDVSSGTIHVSDINNGSSDDSLSLSKTVFGCDNVGPNTVTLSVTDTSGNTSTCQATVTVNDSTPPTAVCRDVTVELSSGSGTITASDIGSGSSDFCGVSSLGLSKTDFGSSDVGANTVELTVSDNNGNESTCDATVTATLPTQSPPSDATVTATLPDPNLVGNDAAPKVVMGALVGLGNNIPGVDVKTVLGPVATGTTFFSSQATNALDAVDINFQEALDRIQDSFIWEADNLLFRNP
jgi:hypothetical protein